MPPSPSVRARPLDAAGLDALVARRAAQAERATDAEVDRIAGLADPADRLAAHAALARLLGEDGAALPPAASDRILRTLHRDAEARERDERRRKWEAERAARLRLDRLRPWALWLGVPLAAGLPAGVAIGLSGWPLLGVLAAVVEAPWLPPPPVLAVIAALCGVGAAAWSAARAGGVHALRNALAGAFAAGALAVAAARSLPVYLAASGARLADGSGIGGGVVRVERLWPARPDKLHVLLGAGRVGRGAVLELRGGQPERYLRGG